MTCLVFSSVDIFVRFDCLIVYKKCMFFVLCFTISKFNAVFSFCNAEGTIECYDMEITCDPCPHVSYLFVIFPNICDCTD